MAHNISKNINGNTNKYKSVEVFKEPAFFNTQFQGLNYGGYSNQFPISFASGSGILTTTLRFIPFVIYSKTRIKGFVFETTGTIPTTANNLVTFGFYNSLNNKPNQKLWNSIEYNETSLNTTYGTTTRIIIPADITVDSGIYFFAGQSSLAGTSTIRRVTDQNYQILGGGDTIIAGYTITNPYPSNVLTIGNGTYSNLNPNGTTQTLAHTQDVGSGGLLLVNISMQNSVTVTGMTYGGVAMTLVRADNSTYFAKNTTTYYLLNPPTGNNNIVISFSGSQFNSTAIFARSFLNAGGIGNHGFDDGLTTPNSQPLTVSNNSIVFATGMSSNAQNFGYDFDGVTATNVGNGFNINCQVEAAYSQSLQAGSRVITTKADFGYVSNHRVEVIPTIGSSNSLPSNVSGSTFTNSTSTTQFIYIQEH